MKICLILHNDINNYKKQLKMLFNLIKINNKDNQNINKYMKLYLILHNDKNNYKKQLKMLLNLIKKKKQLKLNGNNNKKY